MSREPFETMPDMMNAKLLAKALRISVAGAYNLLSSPDFPTLRIGGRKLVMKNELVEWLKSRTNGKKETGLRYSGTDAPGYDIILWRRKEVR